MARSLGSRGLRSKPVQQLNNGVELLGSTGLDVLKKLGAGSTCTETARALGCRKSNVTYWTKKLLAMGALRLQTKDVLKYYSLTPFGSTLLTRSEVTIPGEVVVLEDCAVKFVLLEGERARVDWEKLGEPRNWEKLGVKIGHVRVVKTNRSVIIHPGRLRGFDVDVLEVEAGRVVERVKGVLEGRFGMVLSEEGVPLHKPIYRFYSEEAREDVKYGTAILEGPDGRLSSTDNSPPEHVPHEEYDGKERAIARQRLPDSMKRVEAKVDGLAANLGSLVHEVHDLVEVLRAQAGQAPGFESRQDKDPTRVLPQDRMMVS